MSDWFMEFEDDDQAADGPEPPQIGPPEDQLAGVVPFEVVLGRSSDVAVVLTGMRAFSSGVAMVLGVRLRRPMSSISVRAWDDVFDQHDSDVVQDPQWQQDRLRWGFTFPDGVEVSNLEPNTADVILHGGGGSGSDQYCDRNYWLSALPPAKPFEVFCEWRSAGLPRTRATVDGQLIVATAERSQPLWPSP